MWGGGPEADGEAARLPVKDRVVRNHLSSPETHSLPPGNSFFFFVFHFQTSKFTSEREVGIFVEF